MPRQSPTGGAGYPEKQNAAPKGRARFSLNASAGEAEVGELVANFLEDIIQGLAAGCR